MPSLYAEITNVLPGCTCFLICPCFSPMNYMRLYT